MSEYLEEENYALARILGKPRRVLDVGCGRGINGETAKRKGAYVVGVELHPEAVAAARARLDEVIETDIERADATSKLTDQKFDLILFADVLEHVSRPTDVLRRFLAHLEEDGRVIVSLPNVAAWTVRAQLLRGRFKYEKSGILDETHLRFFTRETAVSLVEDAGLEVLDVELNPMIVRAALGTLKNVVLRGDAAAQGADAMRNSPLYQAYLKMVRPTEGRLAELWASGLAFQNVIVARRPHRHRKLSLTVGMISMNEAGAVGGVIDEIKKHAPEAEILLVDSSKDETPEIAASKGARVVRQFPPRGYGNAMHRLLYEARTDAIVTMDCDGTYPADRILPLLRILEEGADLVNATRTRHRPSAMPLPNYVANRVFAATSRLVHGTPTTDVHSGMRAYRTSMLRGIDVDPSGPALPVDLLVVPARMGYRVVEVEIPYLERVGTSTLQRWDSTKWTFRRIFRAHPGARARSDRFENR